MKKEVFAILATLFHLWPAIILAQFETDSLSLWTKYPGFVVTQEGDTLKGHVLLSNLVANQQKVFFYNGNEQDETEEKYKPKELKAYKAGPRHYESFKYEPVNEARRYHFFLKVIDGPISLYRWYYEPGSRTDERVQLNEEALLNSNIDLSFSENDLVGQDIAIKQDGKPEDLSTLKYLTNFKKNMARFVEDYPALAEKIRKKEEGYTYGFQEDIIREYNEWYPGEE